MLTGLVVMLGVSGGIVVRCWMVDVVLWSRRLRARRCCRQRQGGFAAGA